MSDVLTFLRRLDVFNGLAEAELGRIAQLCVPSDYGAGDVILSVGEPAGCFYLVREGTVAVTTRPRDSRGSEPVNDGVQLTLGHGQILGEMGLVDRGPRSAGAHAISDVAVYAVNCDDFLALCEELPRLGYQVMRNIAADLSFKLRQRNLI
jgi:CRP/FNR family cyclic AMP-dependent transcriptional regulator